MYSKLHTCAKFIDTKTIMELIPFIQKYDWGKRGEESTVATLYKNVDPEFVIEPNETYAELWIGTHVNGPSVVKKFDRPLSLILDENPQYLGLGSVQVFGNSLPYLLKVLSIQNALSIQVHPTKIHAKQLHDKHPEIYKDANHKPELAIALTPFEVLCGFRPSREIKEFFNIIPELRNLIGNKLCINYDKDSEEKTLKKCFQALMTSSQSKVRNELDSLLLRFGELDADNRVKQLSNLVERLHKQFPGDVGCFVVYFLNYLKLDRLQAIYLGVNEPHAYISGDCVECMACSDNVVRAGLTSKYKDLDTLCAMMNYQGEEASNKIFSPINESKYTVIFSPPVSDFAVVQVAVPNGANDLPLVTRENCNILLVVSGTATLGDVKLIPGKSVFVPAGDEVYLQNVSKDFLAFQAMANV